MEWKSCDACKRADVNCLADDGLSYYNGTLYKKGFEQLWKRQRFLLMEVKERPDCAFMSGLRDELI